MACSWPCCATCCSFLSAFGVFFLVILGILMQQKSPSLELDDKVMESQYLAPYICAGVSCIPVQQPPSNIYARAAAASLQHL